MMAKMDDRPYIDVGGASSGALQAGHRTDTKVQCDGYIDLDKLLDSLQQNGGGQTAFGETPRSRDRLTLENVYLGSEIRSELHFDDIVGRSDALRRVLNEIETVAPAESTVLIYGEAAPNLKQPEREDPSQQEHLHHILEKTERTQILHALEACNGLITGLNGAATRLGIKCSTLQVRMKKLGIRRTRSAFVDR